jgi:hypothetical protein
MIVEDVAHNHVVTKMGMDDFFIRLVFKRGFDDLTGVWVFVQELGEWLR